jgi:hypothetical protein
MLQADKIYLGGDAMQTENSELKKKTIKTLKGKRAMTCAISRWSL